MGGMGKKVLVDPALTQQSLRALRDELHEKDNGDLKYVIMKINSCLFGQYPATDGSASDSITDTHRIDWLEKQTKRSPTGISFDWVPTVDGHPSGFRFSRRHMIGDAKETLRGCVDYLIKQGRDNS